MSANYLLADLYVQERLLKSERESKTENNANESEDDTSPGESSDSENGAYSLGSAVRLKVMFFVHTFIPSFTGTLKCFISFPLKVSSSQVNRDSCSHTI